MPRKGATVSACLPRACHVPAYHGTTGETKQLLAGCEGVDAALSACLGMEDEGVVRFVTALVLNLSDEALWVERMGERVRAQLEKLQVNAVDARTRGLAHDALENIGPSTGESYDDDDFDLDEEYEDDADGEEDEGAGAAVPASSAPPRSAAPPPPPQAALPALRAPRPARCRAPPARPL